MTKQQFNEIKNRAWNWYRGNMLEWAIKTLKDIPNAPKWVRDMFRSIEFESSLTNDDFSEQYKKEIERLLVAYQKINFEVNYCKELTEFFEAKRKNDILEMIGEMCDLCLVAMNAGVQLKKVSDDCALPIQNSDFTFALQENSHIGFVVNAIRQFGYDPYLCLLETLRELESRTGSWSEQEGKWREDRGAYALEEVKKLAVKKFREKNAELSEMDETNKHYYIAVADSGDMIFIKKWHKADYSICKINEQTLNGGDNV